MIEKDKIYLLKEASEITRFSPATLRRRIKAGRLKAISKPYEYVRILGSELLKLLENND